MSKIREISGQKIIDSRGKPTVEVRVKTDDGFFAIDSVPSGTSTGSKEAALVDVNVACSNINKIIAPELIGENVFDQEKIDQKMIDLDGTENKAKLGANSILGVSLAVARTASREKKLPLYQYINNMFNQMSGMNIKPKIPTPMMVMLCGGKHVEAEVKPEIQEFSVIASLEDGISIWHAVQDLLKERKINYLLGLEGAFAPQLTNDQSLEILTEAIRKVGYDQNKIRIALDIAGNNCPMKNDDIIELVKKYNVYSLEDPFGEEDWERFGQLKLELEELKNPFLLIGDDLFATKEKLLQKGITHLVANGIIIKPNQVGTLSEVFRVIKIAYQAHFTCVVSHRSGETIDSFISDLAVGTATDFLKAGAPIPSERLVKYQRLKEIAQNL